MSKQIEEISKRIKELREILDITILEMANHLNISIDEYSQYESAQKDIPISYLFEIATKLNVDFTVLLSGESPKMDTYTVVRNGDGLNVQRFKGYNYESLAYNFIHREMEPMRVTLSPSEPPAPLVTHDGQEFNLCLKGKLKVTIGKKEHILNEGDSIYFDPTAPHGQSAIDGDAVFLTVIKE